MVRLSIQLFLLRLFLISVGATAFAEMGRPVLADDVSPEQDVQAVKAFLASEDFTWDSGPTRITNKSIQAAYPDSRFYYVLFSVAGGGADTPKLSHVLRLDKTGKVSIRKHNDGLMKIGSVNEAKVAAAAVMSLATAINPHGPISVEANDVQVSRGDENWDCKAVKTGHAFRVVFDKDGKYKDMNWTEPPKGKLKSQ